jgi:hypothetical protein
MISAVSLSNQFLLEISPTQWYGKASHKLQEDRISRGIDLKSCHCHNLSCVPQPIIYIIRSTLRMYTGKTRC